jgi:hypothetical protein
MTYIESIMEFFNRHNLSYDEFLKFSKMSINYPVLSFEELNKIVVKYEDLTLEDMLMLFKNKKHLDQNLHIKYKLETRKFSKEMEKYKWFVLLKSD